MPMKRCPAGFRREGRRCVELTIYEKVKRAGIPIDHHESDLYVLATPKSIEMTKDIKSRQFFKSQIDGKQWIDLPFQYDPFWKEKGVK